MTTRKNKAVGSAPTATPLPTASSTSEGTSTAEETGMSEENGTAEDTGTSEENGMSEDTDTAQGTGKEETGAPEGTSTPVLDAAAAAIVAAAANEDPDGPIDNDIENGTAVVVSSVAARGRWRIGRHFTKEPVTIACDQLSDEQLEALNGDPELNVALVTVAAEEAE